VRGLTAGLSAALPALLAALGEILPTDSQPFEEPDAKPVEELVLTLTDPGIETTGGKRRARAMAMLVYEPAQAGARRIESRRYSFTAPLGPIEMEDLRWYLEKSAGRCSPGSRRCSPMRGAARSWEPAS
jgi:hypothetical protein